MVAHTFTTITAKYGNVDHLVVAQGGVFAVETKARSKPVTGSGSRDATVIFDGKSIAFPHYVETKALDQARRSARWVAEWLSESTGAPVAVCPVVAIPGWYVKRRGTSDVLVLNPDPGQTQFMNRPGNHGNLPDEKIRQIVYQIEQNNRNVAPGSRKYDLTDSRSV